ncbi:16571_t:CDS:2 [Funneliformis caledonium]|uniref:16571_t:CDS:1 n=1 Tax=Funneliformis caledonium TaxID=1117310 RepID=A0A9N8VBH7_9GLOM|nr:16571_t:CDS:2 [Funneliformis caledonium]
MVITVQYLDESLTKIGQLRSGLSSRFTEMDIDYPEYRTVIATQITIINLDDFYKKFMYACRYNGISETKWLQIFTDLVENSDIMKCYIELDLFS